MNTSDSLHQFGIVPKDEDLPRIRDLLAREVERERNNEEREGDLALLCCVQLFSRGLSEDVLRSGWRFRGFLPADSSGVLPQLLRDAWIAP